MSNIMPLLLIPYRALALDPVLAWAGPGPIPPSVLGPPPGHSVDSPPAPLRTAPRPRTYPHMAGGDGPGPGPGPPIPRRNQ